MVFAAIKDEIVPGTFWLCSLVIVRFIALEYNATLIFYSGLILLSLEACFSLSKRFQQRMLLSCKLAGRSQQSKGVKKEQINPSIKQSKCNREIHQERRRRQRLHELRTMREETKNYKNDYFPEYRDKLTLMNICINTILHGNPDFLKREINISLFY